MAKTFQTEFLWKEFKEFYRIIIPNLNNCDSCGISKCRYCFIFQYDCRMCQIMRCKNCQLFKNYKDLLFKKCSVEQWQYIVNFIDDLFNLSIYSVFCYDDLKPISEKVKNKNFFF